MADDDKKKANGAAKGQVDGKGGDGSESKNKNKKKKGKGAPAKDAPPKEEPAKSDAPVKDDEPAKDDEDAAEADAPAKKDAAETGGDDADAAEPAAAKAAAPEPDEPEWPKSAWGEPLLRLDRKWTRVEARLAWWILVLEIVTLCFAVFLAGMSSSSDGAAKNGLVLRCILGAAALGTAAHFGTRKSKHHVYAVSAALVVGALLGPLWANKGVVYFANFRGWLQNASFIALFGGVSNLAKRLTIWLALLGASVATAQGKHINVDVAMRFLSPRARVPVAIVGWLAGAVVCFAAVWGFVDQIAMENFKVEESRICPDDPNRSCKVPLGERMGELGHEIRRDVFLAGRQASLDSRTIPKVIAGDKFDGYLTPTEWNAWVKESQFERWFPEEKVKNIYAPEGDTLARSPLIIIPGASENVQELLVRELNLLFPFGFLIIGLRFVLRALLAISGQVKVDPNAAHADDDEHALAHDGGDK